MLFGRNACGSGSDWTRRIVASKRFSIKRRLISSTSYSPVERASSSSFYDFSYVSDLLPSHRILLLGMPFFCTGVLLLEGASSIRTYRENFGKKAPIPFTPAHGVAVAFASSLEDVKMAAFKNERPIEKRLRKAKEQEEKEAATGHVIKAEAEFQFNTYRNGEELKNSRSKSPLRILIIGDSTARGVGISNACYPTFPETLATALSKHCDGRPVFWTAFGEPGATTKWIRKQVRNSIEERKNKVLEKLEGRMEVPKPSLKEFYAMATNNTKSSAMERKHGISRRTKQVIEAMRRRISKRSPNETTKDGDILDKRAWIEKLQYHQQLFKAHPFRGYDIIITLSGLNDVKKNLLPFLSYDNDHHEQDNIEYEYFYENDGTRSLLNEGDNGLAGDIKRLLQELVDHSGFDEIRANTTMTSTCTTGHDVDTTIVDDSENNNEEVDDSIMSQRQLHIFLPSFPTRAVPAKVGSALKWIAIRLTAMLDEVKRKIADESSYQVYAFREPTIEDGLEYLQEKGEVWDALHKHEIMLQLVGVGLEDQGKKLVQEMKDFYQHNIADFEDLPLNPLFAPDAVHPSDRGYDFFGRWLSTEIAKRVKLPP